MATERLDIAVNETGAREVSRRISDVGRAASRAQTPLLSLQRLLASYVSFEGLRRLARLADQFTEMENRIRVLDGTTAHYSVTLRRLYDISQETRSSLRDNVLLFQRMGLAQRELGASTEELFQVTRAVGQAIAIQGGLATTSAGAVLQLSQAFGSGRVQLEEFNSVITGLYPIAKAAADGIDAAGGSIARLRKMIADGEVDSRMLFQGILNSLSDMDNQFAQTVPTVSQAFTILRNAALMYVGEINKALGASTTFSQYIIQLAANMDDLVKGVVVLAAALGPALLLKAILAVGRALRMLTAANPVLALTSAFIGAATYAVLFNDHIDDMVEKTSQSATVVEILGATWVGVLAFIKASWEDFPFWMEQLMMRTGNLVLNQWARIADGLKLGIQSIGESIDEAMPSSSELFTNMFKSLADQFKGSEDIRKDIVEGLILSPSDAETAKKGLEAFEDAFVKFLEDAEARRASILSDEEFFGTPESPLGGGRGVDRFARELRSLLDSINPVEAAWRRLAEGQAIIEEGFARGLLSLEQYNQAMWDLQNTLQDEIFPFDAILRGLDQQAELLQIEATQRERLAQIYDTEESLRRRLTEVERQQLDSKLQVVQQLAVEAEIIDEIQAPLTNYIQKLEALNNIYSKISDQEYVSRIRQVRYEFLQTQTDFASGWERGFLRITDDALDMASTVENALVNGFNRATDAFVNFVTTGKINFGDLANSIIADMVRIAAQQAIIGPLLNLFGGTLAGLGGGGGGGGVQLVGSIGRSHGGPTRPNSIYEVVERGEPEMFSAGGRNYLLTGRFGGRVSSYGSGGGGGGGNPIIVKPTIYNNAAGEVSASVATSTDSEGNLSIDVMIDSIEQQLAGRVETGNSPLLNSMGRALGTNPKPRGR